MSLAHSRLKVTPVKAIGDGNCAFNSFTLGYCQEEVFTQIEKNLRAHGQDPDEVFHDFIQAAAEAFKIRAKDANWATIKNRILKERARDSKQLQKTLAPVMRVLAIDLARADKKNYARTVNPLLSAFNNYLKSSLDLPWNGQDDIFKKHAFIKKKFKEIYRLYEPERLREVYNRLIKKKHPEEATLLDEYMRETLLDWWKLEGYNQFLTAMAEPKTWAGDLELAELANYFGVNISVYRKGEHFHEIRLYHGAIPLDELIALSPEENSVWLEDQLRLRAIGGVDDEFVLYRYTPEQLKKRLGAVAEEAAILALIDTCEEKGERLGGMPFPEDRQFANSIPELVARNVIVRAGNGKAYQFADIADYEKARERVRAVPQYEKVLATCMRYYQDIPTISLINDSGIHWDSARVEDVALAEKKSASHHYKKMLTALRENTIEYNKDKHQDLIESAKKDSAKKKPITYSLASGETLKVSKAMQEKLDRELAKKLQREEQKEYKRSLRKK